MKGLVCVRDACTTLSSGVLLCDGGVSGVSLTADSAGGRVIALARDGRCVCTSEDGRLVWTADLCASLEPAPTPGGWFSCEYIVELTALCCCHRDGTLVLLHTAGAEPADDGAVHVLGPERVELIGTFDGGMCAVAWSHDQSRLALVTGIHRLLLLTPTWDVLAEVELTPFALPHDLAHDACRGGQDDDNRVLVSWKPDGVSLALSLVDAAAGAAGAQAGRRSLRLFNTAEPGVPLHALGKNEDNSDVTGLQPSLGWSGDGQLVGLGQSVPSRQRVQVAFFEPNGLRHRELVLPPLRGHTACDTRVHGVAWNSESDLLAVHLCTAAASGGGGAGHSLSVWHRDNYHWECKWQAAYSGGEGREEGVQDGAPAAHGRQLLGWCWDRQRPHVLHVAVLDAAFLVRVHSLEFGWRYAADESGPAGLIATVEGGGGLRLTALAVAQVPPPMAFATLQLSCGPSAVQPVCVTWQPRGTALLSDGSADAGLACLTSTGELLITPLTLLSPGLANRESSPGSRASLPAGPALSILPSHKDDMGEVVLARRGGEALACPPAPAAVQLSGTPLHCGGDVLPLQPALLRLLTWAPAVDASSIVMVAATPACAALPPPGGGAAPCARGDALILLRCTWEVSASGYALRVTATSLPLPTPGASVVSICVPTPVLTEGQQQGGPPDRTSVVMVHTWDGAVYTLHVQAGEAGALRAAFERCCVLPEACPRLLCFALPDCLVTEVQAEVAAAVLHSVVPSLVCVGLGHRSSRLYAHGYHFVSHSCGSIGVHVDHGLLLHISPGPTPVLSVMHVSDLARLASGLSSRGDAAASGGAGDLTGAYASHPLAATMASGAAIPADLFSQGVPLYAGASFVGPSNRALERGAAFVTCVPRADEVVLQAPRGNIETVVPRFLTMARLRAVLDARPTPQWGEALDIARKHRVDLNFLHDHSPSAFTCPTWLRLGVQQVAAAVARGAVGGPSTSVVRKAAASCGHDRWDLLLTDLRETDVVLGTGRVPERAAGSRIERGEGADAPPAAVNAAKYPPPSWYRTAPPPRETTTCVEEAALWLPRASERSLLQGPSKVNRACAHVRSALLYTMACAHPSVRGADALQRDAALNPRHVVWQHPLVLSVITSYARQAPADLEAILRVVQVIAASEARNTQKGGRSGEGQVLPPLPATVASGDAALSHAILVCDSDVELLYTAALGCYDLMLAHAVSQRSAGMDPRETVPFLAGLARMAQPRGIAGAGVECGAVPQPAPGSSEGEVGGAAGWPMPASTAVTLTLPALLPNGVLRFRVGVGQAEEVLHLSPGQVRQRYAIDVHLGRWAKAMDWLTALAYVEVVRGGTGGVTHPDGSLDEEAVRAALSTQLPVDAESIVSSGVSTPVSTLLSMLYTHGLHERAVSALKVPPPVSDESAGASFIHRLVAAVDAARGWWELAGRWVPDRTGAVGAPTGPPTRGATGKLFSSLCLPPYAALASSNRTLDVCHAALAVFLTSGRLECALALCAVHASVPLGAAAHRFQSQLTELMSTLEVSAEATPPAASSTTGPVVLGHLALVLARVLGVAGSPAPASHRSAAPVVAPAPRAGRSGRVDIAALAAGTLEVKSMEELERELRDEGDPASSAPSRAGLGGGAPPDATTPDGTLAVGAPAPPGLALPFTWTDLVRDVCATLNVESGLGAKVAAARLQLAFTPDEDADDAVTALCDAKLWQEASAWAQVCQRVDLVETVVRPSLTDAAACGAADLSARTDSALSALSGLVKSRERRAALPLYELLGHASEEHMMAVLDVEAGDGGSVLEGGGGGSVFSDASSVVSASWLTRGSVVSGASGASAGGSSVLSALSQRSSKTAGVFSHWNRQSVSQTFLDPRHTLKLRGEGAGAGGQAGGHPGQGAAEAEAALTVAGLRQMDRHRRRGEGGVRKDAPPASGKQRGGGRFRPGSDSEQEHWEAELGSAVPTVDHVADLRVLLRDLRAFGLHTDARRLREEHSAMAAALAAAPHPAPRRDAKAELHVMLRAGRGDSHAEEEAGEHVLPGVADPIATFLVLAVLE